ncbi:50S ribosomal protein L24 [Candidatus Gugararchaeum adminiculabundum]|nr:50S ribosomal protein L24 [Candidatus Gugararchaeum adminiculabundum]
MMFMAMTKTRKKRQQHKYRAQAGLHLKQRFVHCHLSKELRAKLATKKRAVQLRKGDKVKVLVGEKKGTTGKVSEVDLNNSKVYIEGITSKKAKGNEVLAPVDPSNLEIIEGDFSDADRKRVLERSK